MSPDATHGTVLKLGTAIETQSTQLGQASVRLRLGRHVLRRKIAIGRRITYERVISCE